MLDPDSVDPTAPVPALADSLPSGLRIGDLVGGKYRVDSVLGIGGMGVVLAARDLSLDRAVALKFTVGRNDEEAVARFVREARIVAKLESEYVVKILDTGQLKSGAPYLVMEYLEGETLARTLARSENVPQELLVDYVLEACDAIAEAHSLGIVHRDLKPSNLFLARRVDGGERVKVLDFGISKTLDLTPLTHSAAFLGSPQYVAPEQIESARTVDHRTDIWALGVLLYEGLSGRRPFSGATLSELCMNILAAEPEPLRSAAPVPKALAESVQRCLAKQPRDRPATVLELTHALAPFASERGRAVLPRIERLGSRPVTGPPAAAALAPADAPADSQRTERTWEGASESSASGPAPWWALVGLGVLGLLVLYGWYASTRSGSVVVEAAPSAVEPVLSAAEPRSKDERALQEQEVLQVERSEPSATAPSTQGRPPPLEVTREARRSPTMGSSLPSSSRQAQGRLPPSVSSSSPPSAASGAATPTRGSGPSAATGCVASQVSENGVILTPSPDRKVTFEWARRQCINVHRSGKFDLDRGSVRIRCQCEP